MQVLEVFLLLLALSAGLRLLSLRLAVAQPVLFVLGGLVLATMCVVAWAAHTVIPGISWDSGFVLGARVPSRIRAWTPNWGKSYTTVALNQRHDF